VDNRQRRATVTIGALVMAAMTTSAAAQPAPVASFTPGTGFARPAGPALRDESATWRTAIATGGVLPRVERLLVVAPDGRIVEALDGTPSRVNLPQTVASLLSDAASQLTLVHNHPGNTSFSGADLAQLARPGVARVVALGHDGSAFEATLGPRYDPRTFGDQLYPAVVDRILFRLNIERDWAGEDLSDCYQLVAHLAAIALHRSGVIGYRAELSRQHLAIVDRFARLFEDVVRTQTRQIGKDLARAREPTP